MTQIDFVYHAWFTNPGLPEGDQDREWVACFIVRAPTPEVAKAWGDHLAEAHALSRGEPLLSSGVERAAPETVTKLPLVVAGVEATAEHIGW